MAGAVAVSLLASVTGCAASGRSARSAGPTASFSSSILAVQTHPAAPTAVGPTSNHSVNPPVLVRPSRTLPVLPPQTVGGSASIAGCPLFPANNPWRQPIAHAAVNPRSAAWVASIGGGRFLHPDFGSNPSYGIPYSTVPAGQPKLPVHFTGYPAESDPGPYPIPPGARIEAGGDAHLLVASGDCHLYELYGAAHSTAGWSAQSGAIFDLKSNALRPTGWTSADAAGLPILPGLVRRDEVQSGHIDHALRFTIARTQRGFISPATHQAGATTDPNVAPMGARFRLKASFDLTSYHGAARVILQCLKTYGMFVADNGSDWYLSGATDTGWNDTDLDQLKQVPGSAFEAIDSGPVHTG